MKKRRWIGVLVSAGLLGASIFAAHVIANKAGELSAVASTSADAKGLRMPTDVLGVKWLASESALREQRPAVQPNPARPGWLLEKAAWQGRIAEVGYYLPQGNVLMYTINFEGGSPQETIEALQYFLETQYGPMGQAVLSTDSLSEKMCWKRAAGRFIIEHCFRNSTIGFLEQVLISRTKG